MKLPQDLRQQLELSHKHHAAQGTDQSVGDVAANHKQSHD